MIEFRDRHEGSDVYVIAAGPTLNYLDPRYFDGRITVGVNEVGLRFTPTTYGVTKYHEIALDLAAAGIPAIVSRHQYGNHWEQQVAPEGRRIHVFDHLDNMAETFDAERDWPTDPDQLVVSWSTVTSAMHFAAYLGARNILMVAHDCGELGGEPYFRGYPVGIDPRPFEPQSLGVKGELVRRYGVRVYSLSPFLNYNLEGVPYVGANAINVAAVPA